MECGVENTDTAFGAAQDRVEESATQYAPADFLRQFGAVIAICLGMALLAHVLVWMVGAN
jgi:GMP synthase-like glutamine amidotransferase